MNPNQYYGSQTNFVPPQNAQPYYTPPAMSPRAPDPASIPPQMNPAPQFNQPMMTPQIPPAQYSTPQYQYANTQNPVNYPPVNAPVQNTQQYQPPPQEIMPNQVGMAQPPMQPPYQGSQPNQMPFYPNQTVPNQNISGSPNQFAAGTYSEQPAQNAPPANTQGNFYNTPQAETQQMAYTATTNAANPPQYTQPEVTASSSQQEPAQYQEPTLETVPKYKPTNVVGDYKCSDFPNLFTGPFRYAGSPVQRKPFTMKGDSHRPTSQPNPTSTDRRSQIGLNRNPKRWELRGGKYYGCFTSRTNGLQDNCPKAKCKVCPTGERKK